MTHIIHTQNYFSNLSKIQKEKAKHFEYSIQSLFSPYLAWHFLLWEIKIIPVHVGFSVKILFLIILELYYSDTFYKSQKTKKEEEKLVWSCELKLRKKKKKEVNYDELDTVITYLLSFP